MKKSEVERLFRVLKEGLVCVLKSVEPCVSFGVSGNRDTGKLEVVIREYKCLYWGIHLTDVVHHNLISNK